MEQVTKDPLARLKLAIDEYESIPLDFGHAVESNRALAKAWQAAFEWRHDFGDTPSHNCPCKSCREDCAKYDEAMALIQEKLQS